MARQREKILSHCDLCGEPIYEDEPHYEMPDGDYICEECVDEWAAQYKVQGVIDLAE